MVPSLLTFVTDFFSNICESASLSSELPSPSVSTTYSLLKAQILSSGSTMAAPTPPLSHPTPTNPFPSSLPTQLFISTSSELFSSEPLLLVEYPLGAFPAEIMFLPRGSLHCFEVTSGVCTGITVCTWSRPSSNHTSSR